MKESRPSVTAERVALLRAAHQRFDDPMVFVDPLAERILGAGGARRLEQARPFARLPLLAGLRAWIVARSRFVEDELGGARARGVEQYVVLGAGLDTFAYRQPPSSAPLSVFEVDHPATQAWKQRRLAEAAIPVPPTVRFVSTDFEGAGLRTALETAGFRWETPAFFSWLGVTMYLTRPAIRSTFDALRGAARGSGLVLDYFDRDAPGALEALARSVLGSRVAVAGEPFRSAFPVGELADELRGRGFREIREIGAEEVNAAYFAGRSDGLQVVSRVGRLLRAER
ncbi:MAG TPA: class I SAM-dependent methyltransferase [Thermoplasmata archaeon]|jgi:methyltransferase (TIGR00027 family)|nr:class I SAM-dependent methyltransferase [Thermoplasmata archaeon]